MGHRGAEAPLPAPHPVRGGPAGARATPSPNAGSDLGSLALRAVLDGDQWVLNGQKIWTSAGHLADHIFTLARTDPDAPKHKGISFLLVDMRQPGIEVRPIRMISGASEFNEVFYTDATCPRDEVVGGVNNGWAVAMTLLGYERGEAAATMPIRFQGELDRLLLLARERGRRRRPAHPPAARLVLLQGPDHALPGPAHADPLRRRSPTRSRRGDQQALLERVPPRRHRARRRHPRRRGAGAVRAASVERLPDRRRRRAQLLVVVGHDVHQRQGGHDLRRVVADPAQHHRRDGARPAEGAEGSAGPASASERDGDGVWGRSPQGEKEPKASKEPSRDEVGERELAVGAGGRQRTRACWCRSRSVQWRRTVPTGWWRRRPFLPVPTRAYVEFRLLTQYGANGHSPSPADVLNYLAWCRQMP